jgi:hypothetical protein
MVWLDSKPDRPSWNLKLDLSSVYTLRAEQMFCFHLHNHFYCSFKN